MSQDLKPVWRPYTSPLGSLWPFDPFCDLNDDFSSHEFVQGQNVLSARIGAPLSPSVNSASRDAKKRYGSGKRARFCQELLKESEEALQLRATIPQAPALWALVTLVEGARSERPLAGATAHS